MEGGERAASSTAAVRTGHSRFRDEEDEGQTRTSACCCCFYGWVIFSVVTLGQLLTFFGTSGGVTFIFEKIKDELHMTRVEISFSYTVGTLVGAAGQIPIGRAVDKLGGRLSIAICSLAFGLSLASLYLPSGWYTLTMAFAAVRTFGFGGLALACTTCLQQWFVTRRGFVTGLAESLASFVGFGLCSILLAAAVDGAGWRTAYLYIGLAVLGYVPIAALMLRSRPEDMGLLPDGRAPTSGEAAHASALGGGSRRPVDGWTLREALRTVGFWVLVASNALQWGIGAGFFLHLESIADERGLPVALLATCFFLPWAVARTVSVLLAGWVLDRAAPRLVLGAGFFLNGASFAAIGWPGMVLTPARAVWIAIVWGAATGLGSATFKITPAAFFGRRHLGAIQGVLQTTNVASTAIGPLVVGAAHDLTQSYSRVLLVIAVVTTAFGVFAALLLRKPARRGEAAAANEGSHPGGAGPGKDGGARELPGATEMAAAAAAADGADNGDAPQPTPSPAVGGDALPSPTATVAAASTQPRDDGPSTSRAATLPHVEPARGLAEQPSGPTRELPEGWEAHEDDDSGQIYFFNVFTGETTWEAPGGP